MSRPQRLRQVFPVAGEVAVDDAARFEGVALNMVASVDGRAATPDARADSRGLAGGPGDRALFHALRRAADAVLVGTRTLRAEDYGRLVPEGRGPVAAVVSRSGDVPVQAGTLADDVRVFTDVADAIGELRADGMRAILCEGGPTLNGALLAAGLVDELHLTLAPQLLGGADPLTIVSGVLDEPVALEPTRILAHEGVLLLRFRVSPPT